MAFHQLVGFPIRDQLHDVPSKDGRPAEAAPMDCVAVSSAACLQWETGRVVSGDELKDVTYGEAHLGGGAEADYARTLPGYGLIAEAAWAPAGRPDILLAAIRKGVIAGHGVLCTIPSAWNSQPRLAGYNPDAPHFMTHCTVATGIDDSDAGPAELMNPWPVAAFPQKHIQRVTVPWLRRRLCWRSVWTLRAIKAGETMHVPAGWTYDAAAHTLHNPKNSYVAVLGMCDAILNDPNYDPDDVPTENERYSNPVEFGNRANGDGTVQAYTKTVRVYTKARGIYNLWAGQEYSALLAMIRDLQAHIATDTTAAAKLAQVRAILG
jgi:hypothetical protein